MLRSSLYCAKTPVYDLVDRAEVLRALDPTEHNMERLNAAARGAGVSYHPLRLRGELRESELRRALDAMTARHPLMRVRIAKDRETGLLVYAPARAPVPLAVIEVDDLNDWPRLIEADANAGPIDSGRGPLFAFALLRQKDGKRGGDDEQMLVELHHHGVADGLSSLWLCHELLTELASPRSWMPQPDRPVSSSFVLPDDLELDLSALARRAGEVLEGGERDGLLAELESLEERLLGLEDEEGRLPARLFDIHSLIAGVSSKRDAVPLSPDEDVGPGPERFERVSTGMLFESLSPEVFSALRSETKLQGLTVHSALTAAVLFAYAERQWAAAPAERGTFPLATPVSLREQFLPTLERADLRMAVDVSITHTPVSLGDGFWDVARRTGSDVAKDVRLRRTLSSWFRTPRRDLDSAPPGVPVVTVSNLGKSLLHERYGDLELVDFAAASATHGGFALGLIFSTFRGALRFGLQFETPTVSRASAERFAISVYTHLESAALGKEPVLRV